jgi:putative ABC transport system permease protein
MKKNPAPPQPILRFFRWFAHPKLRDHIEGDLIEIYAERVRSISKRRADVLFLWDVLMLFRPGILRPAEGHQQLNTFGIFRNYIKVGWRNIVKEKGYSSINIGGFAIGIGAALLIGLWVVDEFAYDKHHEHYDKIAVVLQNNIFDGHIETSTSQSYQLGEELRTAYGSYFDRVVMSTYPSSAILAHDDKTFSITGCYMESGAPELLSLEMTEGTRAGLSDPSSILLSASTAEKFFAGKPALGQTLRLDNGTDVKVAGVFKDMPQASSFNGELYFIAHLDVIVARGGRNFSWVNNWLQVFVQLGKNVSIEQASIAVRDAKKKYYKLNDPALFLHGMPRWRLYSGFSNGISNGGRIEMVWLFGAIGVFILLLASVNFMNISTARARKRAKEIGVRKVIGSARPELVKQFFTESLLTVTLSFLLAIVLVQLALPWFNLTTGKHVFIPWSEPWFIASLTAFIFTATVISGSYPAIYLSSFKPVNILRGTLHYGGSFARKSMVVFQFTISIALIIVTSAVYKQVTFVKNKPTGYDLQGLITIPIRTDEVKKNYRTFRNELIATGLASEVSTSETTVTNMWWSDFGFQWNGKDPGMQDMIHRGAVDYEFGKTVGWTIKEGRDFSRDFGSDSAAMILNEAAVKYMGFKNPIGEKVRQYGRDYTVIGVVHDMVTQSIYEPARQTIFVIDPFNSASFINVKLAAKQTDSEMLVRIGRIFSKHNPSTPFEYTFAGDEFGDKIAFEVLVARLVAAFAALAICISCLGLFGLSSFVAEQRTKEIGVRKVLGASVTGLWKMLSKDFVVLVCVAIAIATPAAYLLTKSWLQSYTYRTDLPWWIFAGAGASALIVTILTVSFQSIRVALRNPVKSLRID